MRRKASILLLLLVSVLGMSQPKKHTFEEAEELCAQNPKPYVIFIKTSWCKFCNLMEKSTFQNDEVVKVLDNDFYFIVLDAEEKETINFNDRAFRFLPNGIESGVHELAAALATSNDGVSYPTLVVLAPDYTISLQKPSFIDTENMIRLLQKLKEHQ